jgi:hypothetical protein
MATVVAAAAADVPLAQAAEGVCGIFACVSDALMLPLAPITFCMYSSETQLAWISHLMESDLSEPYSDFTYRYFLNQWYVFHFVE